VHAQTIEHSYSEQLTDQGAYENNTGRTNKLSRRCYFACMEAPKRIKVYALNFYQSIPLDSLASRFLSDSAADTALSMAMAFAACVPNARYYASIQTGARIR